jgi:hypothetical protein
MTFHIGGDFELAPPVLASPAVDNIPLVPGKTHTFTDTGRSAIFLALSQILENTGIRRAWLPYYCCPTIVTSFHQLEIEVYFYGMGSDLEQSEGLPKRLENAILLFIHYFGIRNHALQDYIRSQQASRDTFVVIEDCVQSCLSTNFGGFGDYSIHSLRKFLPLTDGGIVGSPGSLPEPREIADEAFVSEKFLAKLLRGADADPREFLTLCEHAEQKIENKVRPKQMSSLSRFILGKLDIASIQSDRRRNWLQLSRAFQSGALADCQFRPLYRNLDEDEVPLAFPVVVETGKRDSLKTFLAGHNIYCPVHWHLNQTGDHKIFPLDLQLSQSILTIPIDQRISPDGLDYLIYTLPKFEKETI